MRIRILIPVIIVLYIGGSLLFSENKPAHSIIIKNAHIIPVIGEELPEGDILIQDRLIKAIGKNLEVPPGAEIIDGKGFFAYPGMIDSHCPLGICEISNLAATTDFQEIGQLNPQVKVLEALKPDSIHIPVARANGITAAHVVPQGQFIAGQTGLIRLNGWIPKEMIIKSPVAMHVLIRDYPKSMRGSSVSEEKKIKAIEELKDLFAQVRLYKKAKETAAKNLRISAPDFDEALEFMIPVVEGQIPVMFSANSEKEIQAVIDFIREEKIKVILYGAREAEKMVDKIKELEIPVILGSLLNMPSSWEEGYDSAYRTPAVLQKAGIIFAFSSERYLPPLSVDLPYQASKAIAFGLDQKEALKAVTINPARIFGVGDRMGSLEPGKEANIVLTDGDILDRRTNICHILIDGKPVDLSNEYTDLLKKFEERIKPKKIQ